MDDAKRQFYVLGAIGVIVAGLYLFGELAGDPPPEEGEQTEQTAEGSEGAEGASEGNEGEGTGEGDAASVAQGLEGTPLVTAPVDRSRDGESTYTIDTELFRATFTDHGGGLVRFELKNEQFADAEGALLNLVTTDKERYLPFRLQVTGADVPSDAVWQGEQVSPRAIVLRWSGNGMRITRRIEAGEAPYQLWSTVNVKNEGEGTRYARLRYFTHHYVTQDDESGGFIGRPSTHLSHGLCVHRDEGDLETEREAGEALSTDVMGWGTPEVVGMHDTYFANMLVAANGPAERCVLAAQRRPNPEEYHGTLFQAELRYPAQELASGESLEERTLSYVGPADRDALRTAGHGLTEVIDLGWFSFIANGLIDVLRWLYSLIGNWGFAIILLTLMVKAIFYPLTVRSFRSMAAMRKLKPKIDALNEKYGDDREKKGAATMELYRKEGVNPAAGCLPSLLQMPVWFALYRSLSTNIELYKAPFALWWTDLSAPDPYFVLPVMTAVLMHLQQRLTPSTMDPAQAKIFMYLMPIVFGAFLLFLPAGLCLYIVTNSSLTIIQQRWIYAKLDREEAAAASAPTTVGDDDPEEDSSDDDDADAEEEEKKSSSSSVRRRRTSPKGRKKRQRRGRA